MTEAFFGYNIDISHASHIKLYILHLHIHDIYKSYWWLPNEDTVSHFVKEILTEAETFMADQTISTHGSTKA